MKFGEENFGGASVTAYHGFCELRSAGMSEAEAFGHTMRAMYWTEHENLSTFLAVDPSVVKLHVQKRLDAVNKALGNEG